MLTKKQMSFYRENGYLVVEDVVSPERTGSAATSDL